MIENSISNQDAAKLGYQGQTDMSKSLSVVHALFDKITNEARPLKVIDHLEKLTVDVDTLLYVGAAGGYLAKLVSMLASLCEFSWLHMNAKLRQIVGLLV